MHAVITLICHWENRILEQQNSFISAQNLNGSKMMSKPRSIWFLNQRFNHHFLEVSCGAGGQGSSVVSAVALIAAVVKIPPLVQELPYAIGMAKKKRKILFDFLCSGNGIMLAILKCDLLFMLSNMSWEAFYAPTLKVTSASYSAIFFTPA